MVRTFNPEEEAFRWDDLSRLPKVGKLLFDVADILAEHPVSRELDAVVMKRDASGVFIETPIPARYQPNPIMILKNLASFEDYRSPNKKAWSKKNAAIVSRLSAASVEYIYQRLPPAGVTFRQAEGVRSLLGVIHYKMTEGYMGIPLGAPPDYENTDLVNKFTEAGHLISGH